MFHTLSSHTVREALSRAFAAFRARHPDYAAALFDEHFLRIQVLPLLAAPDGAAALTPDRVAKAWSAQFSGGARGRENLIAWALPVAADFIDLLARTLALPDEPRLALSQQEVA